MDTLWMFGAGLGIFLLGINMLERAIGELSGRTFKLFLRRHTSHKLKAILSGTLVTAVLQSSSVVNFVMLAFVGAGIVSMRNALAVVLGSNLGTTASSWIVATLGFKLDIEAFAFPLITVAAVIFLSASGSPQFKRVASLVFGFGLMFLGLEFMKDSVESFVETMDLSKLSEYPLVIFAVAGLVITAIIQSSSATMVITLSAVHAGAIPLDAGAAVVVGSELGTTLKILLGAIGGTTSKVRVAIGNVIYNLATSIGGFLLIHPGLYAVKYFGVHDELMSLVMFQSGINLLAIILFFPVLDYYSSFLESIIPERKKSIANYICDVNPNIPDAAEEAFEKEVNRFLLDVISFNKSVFESKDKFSGKRSYDLLKQLEGEITGFFSVVADQSLRAEDRLRFRMLISAVRSAMYSAKNMKDIIGDRNELADSANDFKYRQFIFFRKQVERFYRSVGKALELQDKHELAELLRSLKGNIVEDYNSFIKTILGEAHEIGISRIEMSTLLNVNRELLSAHKSIIAAIGELRLDRSEIDILENIPGTL